VSANQIANLGRYNKKCWRRCVTHSPQSASKRSTNVYKQHEKTAQEGEGE
jgi:hypothetical protein